MREDVINIGITDAFVFLAIFHTLYISFFIIKKGRKYSKGNIYQGLLFVAIALIAIEAFLNSTGYITHIWWLTCYSQPMNYLVGPLFYLYVFYTLYPEKEPKKKWCHFIFSIFWTCYLFFYYVQPNEIKYNGYITMKHLDWEYIYIENTIPEDPLGLKEYGHELSFVFLISYFIASIVILLRRTKELGQSLFHTKMLHLISIRNSCIHGVVVFIISISLRLVFGKSSMEADLIVVIYFSCLALMIIYKITDSSTSFERPFAALDPIIVKYKKSSLTESQKDEILRLIKYEMEENHYFTGNMSSLSGLAKLINESPHHLSQVINERLGKNFYELLASYRIEYAKKLINDESNANLTLEEIAERVGYNAKSSFNTAFKKYTLLTPSEYKKKMI